MQIYICLRHSLVDNKFFPLMILPKDFIHFHECIETNIFYAMLYCYILKTWHNVFMVHFDEFMVLYKIF